MIRYVSSFFQRVSTGYQHAANALPYALPYYNRQFLQYSTHDHFLCYIRCITVHVTMYFKRNKYKIVPFSMGFHELPSIL